MGSLGRHHCRNQSNLRGCHNNIQHELKEMTEEHTERLRRKANRAPRF